MTLSENRLECIDGIKSQKTLPYDPSADSIFKEINTLVRENELFLIHRVSLKDISEQIGLSPADISWAINRGGGKSFADYINQFRVCLVIESIKANPSKSLLELAFDSGFSSKSSFNEIFKKFNGCTPSEFKKTVIYSANRNNRKLKGSLDKWCP